MEHKVTNFEVRERMLRRGIKVADLATASDMFSTDVSAILSGSLRIGQAREAKLARGIVRLGLDRDEPDAPPRGRVVEIRIWSL